MLQVLKTLQDDVPAFSGKRAQAIVAAELGVNDVLDVFDSFEEAPLAAASLGQVSSVFREDACQEQLQL